MQYDIQASLLSFLNEKTGLPVVWIYDGVELPTVKPFITIEQMQNQTGILAKVREAAQTTYRFQVGIYANTNAERSRLQDEVKRILLFEPIPLIGSDPVGYFDANVEREVPMPADNLANKTSYHHVYLDVTVEAFLYKN